jgi:hypothetical protein
LEFNVYAADLYTGKLFWKNSGLNPSAFTISALAKKRSGNLIFSQDNATLLRMSPGQRKKAIAVLKRRGVELPRMPVTRGLDNPLLKSLKKNAAAASVDFISLGGMKTSSVAVNAKNVYVVQKDLGYVLINDSLVEYKQQFGIQAFDKYFGDALWSFGECRASAEQGYCSSPVVTKKAVYFGWGEGRMYGLDAETGVKMWEDSLEGHILSSPAIAGSRLYVATMDGYIYAYNLNATAPGLDFQTSTYCYPNPARGSVSKIQIYVTKKAVVDMTLYNAAEKPVFRVSEQFGPMTPDAPYTYSWNISRVANGVYFALIKVNYADGTKDRKVLKVAVLK